MKYLIFLFLISCSTPMPEIKLPEPPVQEMVKLKKLSIFMTVYYVPNYKSVPDAIPLRDQFGKSLGVSLPLKQMCNAQLQGSVVVDKQMYGYWKATPAHKVDCSSISSKIAGTVKFRKENTKYGTGVNLWPLKPFKSIAVKPSYIPYGSKVFIPCLKGVKYTFEGTEYIHNGIVEALDTGGVLRDNQVDFFLGPISGKYNDWRDALAVNPFKCITSKKSDKFDAWIIE